MKSERTDRRRDPSRARVASAPPLAGELDLPLMSDFELMRRLAMLEPERYAVAYAEMRCFARYGEST